MDWHTWLIGGGIGLWVWAMHMKRRLESRKRSLVSGYVQEAQKRLRQKRLRRGIRETLKGYREKFRHGPVGGWSTGWDYSPAPSESLTFYPDGSGVIEYFSGEGNSRSRFEWESVGEQTLFLRLTEDGLAEAEEDGEPVSGVVRYDFAIVTLYGPTIVMQFIPGNEGLPFWLSGDDLLFTGDAADEET